MHIDRYCLDCEYFQRVSHDTKGVVVLDQIWKALEIYSLDVSLVEGISCQSCDHFLWMMSFLQLYAQYHLLEYSMSIISLDSLSPSGIPTISLRTVTAGWLWWCIPNLPSHVPIITSEPKFYTSLEEHILLGNDCVLCSYQRLVDKTARTGVSCSHPRIDLPVTETNTHVVVCLISWPPLKVLFLWVCFRMLKICMI